MKDFDGTLPPRAAGDRRAHEEAEHGHCERTDTARTSGCTLGGDAADKPSPNCSSPSSLHRGVSPQERLSEGWGRLETRTCRAAARRGGAVGTGRRTTSCIRRTEGLVEAGTVNGREGQSRPARAKPRPAATRQPVRPTGTPGAANRRYSVAAPPPDPGSIRLYSTHPKRGRAFVEPSSLLYAGMPNWRIAREAIERANRQLRAVLRRSSYFALKKSI